MPSREQVLRLLRSGLDYPAVGERLGVPPGQAYLVATGLPADGSDAMTAAEARRPGWLPESTQHLANPPAENPTSKEVVAYWMKARALADAEMRTAAKQRDAEPGPIEDPDNVREVTTVLGRDHNQVKAMLEQLETIPGRRKGGSVAHQAQRKSIVDMVTVALSRHESTEQEYLWPKVRRVLPHGDELARQALAQEQEGKDTLTALGRLAPDTAQFDELVEQLVLQARKHVAFEDTVFLRLTEAMSARSRTRLGRKIHFAEKLAPTRPHPHAPKRPAVAVKLAGAAAAPVDLLRDAVGHRPAKRKGRPEGHATLP